MLHRDMKGKGILLNLTRDILRDEPSKHLIEEPFTTFHNRTLLGANLSGMFVVYSPLPFETFIKMFNYLTITDNKLDIGRILSMN